MKLRNAHPSQFKPFSDCTIWMDPQTGGVDTGEFIEEKWLLKNGFIEEGELYILNDIVNPEVALSQDVFHATNPYFFRTPSHTDLDFSSLARNLVGSKVRVLGKRAN